MKSLIFFLCTLIFLTVALRDDPKYWEKYKTLDDQSVNLSREQAAAQLWFSQIVDHFDYQKTVMWKQRYWVIDSFFNPNNGPVFIFICGEYVCQGVPSARQWVVTMAQKLQGLILVLEHRYYGQSMPFGNSSLNLDKMVYLNSEQALADLAYFVQQMKETHSHKIVDKSPFIAIGGSYPGALSAWFRYKYPHLTIGAIASSAVIQAIQDFPDFDEQIYLSSMKSGQYCASAINNSLSTVESKLRDDPVNFKKSFEGGEMLTDDQFKFFWIDSIVGLIQYGQRTTLCDNVKNKSSDQVFQYFVSNAKTNDVYEYGSYYLKNITFSLQNGQGARAWYYQSCSQFGYWQTFSRTHPLRFLSLDINFYKKFCNDSFGNSLWPQIQRKNMEYGGLDLRAFNLYMVNGDQDPWKWASLLKSTGNIISRVANCTNCAHCVELYTPKLDDPPQLKSIRDDQFITVMGWIEDHWRSFSHLSQQSIHLTHTNHLMHVEDQIKIRKFKLNQK